MCFTLRKRKGESGVKVVLRRRKRRMRMEWFGVGVEHKSVLFLQNEFFSS